MAMDWIGWQNRIGDGARRFKDCVDAERPAAPHVASAGNGLEKEKSRATCGDPHTDKPRRAGEGDRQRSPGEFDTAAGAALRRRCWWGLPARCSGLSLHGG